MNFSDERKSSESDDRFFYELDFYAELVECPPRASAGAIAISARVRR
jgi:hypothetical protein